MNTKVLIETLTEVPDIQLLAELQQNLSKNDTIIVPDIRKLFEMFSAIFMSKNKPVILKAMLLMSKVNTIILMTELEVCWQHVSRSLICLIGEQDEEIRKKSKSIILQFLKMSNNAFMILEKLYYEGMQNESLLVISFSIKLIFKVLEDHNSVLDKKSNINIVKLILEKMIRLTSKDHSNLNKNAREFLDRLFYLKIEKMDEVLQRMDQFYLVSLEKIWEKNKENMLYKHQPQKEEISVKYEHLPLIGQKIFGIYEPFILKNIFNPETASANRYSIKQFKTLFYQNQERLTKYINVISKIIIKVLPEKHLQIVQMLHHIIGMPGICNIVNMSEILRILIEQLSEQNVTYRRQVRQCMKKLNFGYRDIVLSQYSSELQALKQSNSQHSSWIKIYEIFLLVEHWVENVEEPAQCFPPILDPFIKFSARNLKNPIGKIRDKSTQFLFEILQKYSSYRETLQEIMTEEELGQLEDRIQSKKNQHNLQIKHNSQAKETFVQEYQQQRTRFLTNKRKL